MSSFMCVLYIALFTVAGAADPDALYRARGNLASAREAAGIWAARLQANPRDFESAWKLARAQYWLGGHGSLAEQRKDLERGVEAGKELEKVIAVPPGPEWAPEDREYKQKAEQILARMRREGRVK